MLDHRDGVMVRGLDGKARLWQGIAIEAGYDDALEAVLRERLNAVTLDGLEACGKWGDVPTIKQQATLARAKEGLAPWYGIWDVFARAEIQKGILGQQSSLDILNNMAAKWVELKAAQ